MVLTLTYPITRFRVRMRVADPGWLRRLLLRLGPAVARVDPPQAAASAIEAAREALGGEKLEIRYQFTVAVNGVATVVPYGRIEQILAVVGSSITNQNFHRQSPCG